MPSARVDPLLPASPVDAVPPSNPFNRALDIEFRRGRVSDQVLAQYLTLVHPSFAISLTGRALPDEDELDASVAELEQVPKC